VAAETIIDRVLAGAPGPLEGALRMFGAAAADTLHAVDVLGAIDAGAGAPADPLDARDPEYIRHTLPALKMMSDLYFRGEVRGLRNIPRDQPVLLVGNHSGGTLIADTFVFAQAFYEHFGADRVFHQLAHDMVFKLPGVHETYRPSWESSDVDFDGRTGFVKLALELGVPIVPVVAIGGQETALFLGQGRGFADRLGLDRLMRVKVLPAQIGPPFGLTVLDLPGRIPLPAKITVRVLPKIDLRKQLRKKNPDVDEAYELVTGKMQRALDKLADERTLPVVG